MRSFASGVPATGLDDLPRLADAEISDGLLQACSLDDLARIFERLAYKALYCALVVETQQRNGVTYRAIARRRHRKTQSVEGVLQTAVAGLLAQHADPDPSKDLDQEFRRLVYNEAKKRARRGWSRPRAISLDDEEPGKDALRLRPTQEPILITEESFAILHTDEHRRVLRLWIDGFSSKEIAEQLGISPRTVDRRKSDIRNLLGPELRP